MDTPHPINDEQARLWNGHAGHAWVEAQRVLDRMLQPFEDLLMEVVHAARPKRLLDIGCGTGSTTLAAARLLGGAARCTGVDISGPMIAAARDRAALQGLAVEFVQADVQAHAFEPAAHDLLISRFGVMFFDDPVRAFANLRHAAAPGAALHFAAWRGADENPFMTTAERAAAPLLPALPARRPGAPGQFAFADAQRIRAVLEGSGWEAIGVRPVDAECSLAEQDLVPYLKRLGPLGLALQDADERTRTAVVGTVRAAFDRFVLGGEVRFTSACWMVEARAPA
ncbi:MAG: class I SAM-dependent methyltransferase [Aquabacterium sp.]|nr:MAG: class I SAM-dependent methyltransferase [Aquabacterium sp.]